MIGAVNVAYFNKKRELIGNNFDGDGFISGLKSQGYQVKGKRIFLAGAGGASRAIAFSLAKNQVYSIYIINRTEATASDLCNSVLKWYPDLDIKLYKDFSECDILINTTSLGLKESDELPFDVDKSSSSSLIADIIMKPEMTRLLNKAKLINRKIHLGKHMLDYQIELMENFLTKDI
jgi:shikimate dehydrogenase